MVTGIISAVCVFLLLLKYLSRRFGWQKADRFLKRLHQPIAILLVCCITGHVLQTRTVWDKRHTLVIGAGILAAVCLILLVVTSLLRNRLGNRFLKVHRIVAVLLLATLLTHMGSYFWNISVYQSRMKSTVLTGIDAGDIPDGEYVGEYSVGFIYAKVSVEVESGRITGIELLKHGNERGLAGEKVIDEVLMHQNTDVDAVSGATNSSKVILKAIENALAEPDQNKVS